VSQLKKASKTLPTKEFTRNIEEAIILDARRQQHSLFQKRVKGED